MKIAASPSLLMVVTWLVFLLIFFSTPIIYDHEPTLRTWAVMFGFVIVFAISTEAGRRLSPQSIPSQSPSDLNRFVTVCAIAGLIGSIAIAVDKIALHGFDWSQGLTLARDKRSVEVIAGIPGRRTFLTYLGYILLPLSMVSLVVFILDGERLRRTAGYLGQISIIPMTIYAVVYGGRMPVLIVLLLIAGACFTRKAQGKSLLPQGWHLPAKIATVALLLTVYTAHVFADRREVKRIQTFEQFMKIAEVHWGLHVEPNVQALVRSGDLPPGLTMDTISTMMYLTHGPTTVEKLLRTERPMPALWGLYQVGILSPLLDTFFPQAQAPARMRSQLQGAGLFGWFATAWGALMLDFGAVGAVVFTIVWGAMSGAIFQRLQSGGGIAEQLLGSFLFMAILMSPLSSPLGMANSFEIFAAFCLAALLLHLRRSPSS